MSNKSHRGSIILESGQIVSQQSCEGHQFILRMRAPNCATLAKPGQFVHLQCDPLLAMRRPLSIMRVNSKQGWIELLYKAVGQGTRLLGKRQAGDAISVLGPIGRPFQPTPERPRALLLGGGVGMPPMLFLAEYLKRCGEYQPLVLLGSEVPFPFSQQPSRIMIPGIPDGVIGSMPLLEDLGIASRLTTLQGYPGCYNGYITDLARCWLNSLSAAQREQVEIFACGPHPMLEATAKLASDYGLPCQVSLEEFMACAVGGCAGCAVRVTTPSGHSMKRVCVDGPVFDAYSVFADIA